MTQGLAAWYQEKKIPGRESEPESLPSLASAAGATFGGWWGQAGIVLKGGDFSNNLNRRLEEFFHTRRGKKKMLDPRTV